MLEKLMAICGFATAARTVGPAVAQADCLAHGRRTPEEAKARRKAYRRRKAAEAAKRRDRK